MSNEAKNRRLRIFSLKNSEEKAKLKEYLESKGYDLSKKFRCINPEYKDKNQSMRYDDAKRCKVHCFSCGVDYDVYDVKKVLEGESSRFFSPLEAKFKTEANNWGGEFSQKQSNSVNNFTGEEGSGTVKIAGTKGEEYLFGRGFTKEIIAEMGIRYDAETESIVIPYKGKKAKIMR